VGIPVLGRRRADLSPAARRFVTDPTLATAPHRRHYDAGMKPPSPRRRLLVAGSAATALLAMAGCASRPAPSTVAALAPTGRLRASINLGNPVLARRDPATGLAAGVSVDLARSLAEQLGVPVELIVFDAAAKSVEAVTGGSADIGFFAIDRCAPRPSASVRPTS
jgi:ABC-type amino acid transport substrate-binding protein